MTALNEKTWQIDPVESYLDNAWLHQLKFRLKTTLLRSMSQANNQLRTCLMRSVFFRFLFAERWVGIDFPGSFSRWL
jgi:hypothetical protein